MENPSPATHASATPQPQAQQPPAVPYVGSRISLISKSAIRYVGTLYTIDTKASTVALKDVRSFGTEGRPREGGPVEPSDRVYSFIVFHGRDILDLQFLTTDTAPPPNPPAAPVKQVTPHPSPDAPPEAPTNAQPAGDPQPPVRDQNPPSHRAPLRGPTPRAWGPPPTPPRCETETNHSNQQYDPSSSTPVHHIAVPKEASFPESRPTPQRQTRVPREIRPRTRGRGRPFQGNGRQPWGTWRRGPGITIPDEDFDFASMHEKFEKASLADPTGESSEAKGFPNVEVCYDKSKSFFDELVPEKEMRTGRYNAAQQRATDMATFGEAGGYHRGGFRSGRGRRGRGRGRGRPRQMGTSSGTDSRPNTNTRRNDEGKIDNR